VNAAPGLDGRPVGEGQGPLTTAGGMDTWSAVAPEAASPAPSFFWSHDPDDPCSLCVTWLLPADAGEWVEPEEMTPVLSDGLPAARIYRNLHPECIPEPQ